MAGLDEGDSGTKPPELEQSPSGPRAAADLRSDCALHIPDGEHLRVKDEVERSSACRDEINGLNTTADIEMNAQPSQQQVERADEPRHDPGAAIPISIPNTVDPPHGRAIDDDDEEDSTSSKYAKRLLQLALLAGIICALIFGGQAVGEAIEKLRSGLQRIPVWAFTLGLVTINFIRFSFIPAYFLFPVGTIAAMYYGDALGAIKGAVALKLCELINALAFLVIRRFYTAPVNDLFEEGRTSFSRSIPSAIRRALQHFDGGWRVWIREKPWVQQLLIMVALQTAFYMDDLVTIIWLATRSHVSWPLYCAALLLYLCADFPRKVLQVETFLAASEALSSGGNFLLEFFNAFGRIPTWQVVCIVVFSVSATIFVHGRHLYIASQLLRHCCGDTAAGEAAQQDFDKVDETPHGEGSAGAARPRPESDAGGHPAGADEPTGAPRPS